MRMGFFLRKGSHLFFAEREGKLVGCVLGTTPNLNSEPRGIKSFAPAAVYVDPKNRSSFRYHKFFNNLINYLRKNGFDNYYVIPDYHGILTKKGNEVALKSQKLLKKVNKSNEGFFGGGDTVYSFSLKKSQRIYEKEKISPFIKKINYLKLKTRQKINRLKRRIRK